MKSVGVRELRQNASALLRRVEAGESVEITDRGRPVARMVPISAEVDILEHLIAEGRATRAAGDMLDIEPMELPPGSPLLSEILAEVRRDER